MTDLLRDGMTKKCLESTPHKDINDVWKSFKSNTAWLNDFSCIIYNGLTNALKSKTSIKKIADTLTSHMGKYPNSDLLILLQRIHALMVGKIIDDDLIFNQSQNAAYAEKLYEGMVNCGAGFYDRTQSMWMGWKQINTFCDRLELFREELVQRTAIALSDDVHDHNHINEVASRIVGIRSVNEKDPYVGNFKNDFIELALKSTFKVHYHPMGILRSIEDQLRGEFIFPGYKGRLLDAFSYSSTEVDALNNLLMGIFPHVITPENPNVFWELSDNLNYLDLNWDLIRKLILEKLHNEAFFKSADVSQLIGSEALVLIEDQLYFRYSMINSLDDSAKVQFLTTLHPDNKNDLMLAVEESNSAALSAFLKAVSSLENESDKIRILSQCDSHQMNVLMIAAKHDRSSLPELIQTVCSLEIRAQAFTLLTSLTPTADLFDVLTFLLEKDPSGASIPLILSYLTREEKIKYLIQSHAKGNNNLLMLVAKKNQPQLLLTLIQEITKLSDKKITDQFLKQLNDTGNNALMIAIRHQIGLKIDFYLAIPRDLRAEMLTQCNSDGRNAFMLASQYQPKLVADFLLRIAELDVHKKIFTQCDQHNNENFLMLAMGKNPLVVPDLLHAMSTLDDKSIASDVLTKSNSKGEKPLMVALENKLTCVPELLKVMTSLDDKSISDILIQSNWKGENPLMFALKNKLTCVPELVKVMTLLDDKSTTAQILSKINRASNENTLMFAMINNPLVVPDLLNAMDKLHDKSIVDMLTQLNWEGENPLMFALKNKLTCVPGLLKLTSSLKDKDLIARLLTQCDITIYDKNPPGSSLNGQSTLMLAINYSGYYPKIVPNLVEMIATLGEKNIEEVLLQQRLDGENALMIASCQKSTILIDLLNIAASLDNKNVIKMMLTQCDSSGRNILMRMCEYRLKVGPSLFAILIDNNCLGSSLTQSTNYNQKNALGLAINRDEEIALTLLDAIVSLNDKGVMIQALTNKPNGLNNLIEAFLNHEPKVASALFKIINSLEDKRVMIDLLTDDENVLMHAIESHSPLVPDLLKAIASLDDKNAMTQALTKRNMIGENALTRAMLRSSEYVPELLNMMISLKEETIISEFMTRKLTLGINGHWVRLTPLLMAFNNRHELIPMMVKSIDSLTNKEAILNDIINEKERSTFLEYGHPKHKPYLFHITSQFNKNDTQLMKPKRLELMSCEQFSDYLSDRDFCTKSKISCVINMQKNNWLTQETLSILLIDIVKHVMSDSSDLSHNEKMECLTTLEETGHLQSIIRDCWKNSTESSKRSGCFFSTPLKTPALMAYRATQCVTFKDTPDARNRVLARFKALEVPIDHTMQPTSSFHHLISNVFSMEKITSTEIEESRKCLNN
jgi:hypothetical protein